MNSSKVLFLVCARNGSKGIPNKNVLKVAGKPLITHTLEQLQASPIKTHLALSTDGNPIASTCGHLVDHVIDRPSELATDEMGRYPVLIHALKACEQHWKIQYDYIFDFLGTAPLRKESDIEACYQLIQNESVCNVVTGVPSHRNPYFNMLELKHQTPVIVKNIGPLARRQDAPATYDMNGSIYAWKRRTLLESPELFREQTRMHIMDSRTGVDVDTAFDLEILEYILTHQK